MRLYLFLVCVLLTSCTMDPCGDKEQFLANFETLLDDSKDAIRSDDPDWEKIQAKFEKMTNDCYMAHKEELSGKEKRLFWKDAMYLVALNAEEEWDLDLSIDDDGITINTDDPEIEQIAKEIEEAFEGSEEAIEEIVEDFLKNDAPDLIDKAMEELGKFAEELKEALKEEQ